MMTYIVKDVEDALLSFVFPLFYVIIFKQLGGEMNVYTDVCIYINVLGTP